LYVAECDIGLEDLKSIAKDLKAIRPVQKIISASLRIEWEEVERRIAKEVSADQLHRFVVRVSIVYSPQLYKAHSTH
jgi:long-subunit acyl-CoA synthetase (AMP-forming)